MPEITLPALLIVIIFGLAIGSFVNALVWRLRQQEKPGKTDKKLSIVTGRSICPRCGQTLKAQDLIPVLSWLSLGGKCRYCHKPISPQYPLVELITAGLFVLSWAAWPLGGMLCWAALFIWLVALTILIALAVYDAKWMILPDRLIYPLLLAGLIFVPLQALRAARPALILESLAAAIIISGLFFIIYQASKGKWIGGGDVKLGAALGLFIGSPPNALLLLFLASFAGTLSSIPIFIAKGQKARRYKIPFGPFLIAAAIICVLFGYRIIDWYLERLIFV